MIMEEWFYSTAKINSLQLVPKVMQVYKANKKPNSNQENNH